MNRTTLASLLIVALITAGCAPLTPKPQQFDCRDGFLTKAPLTGGFNHIYRDADGKRVSCTVDWTK